MLMIRSIVPRSEADPNFRGSKRRANASQSRQARFRSRPELQGVKTPRRHGRQSRKFRSRPELQGVKTHRRAARTRRVRFRSRPELQGVKTWMLRRRSRILCGSEADPNFRGSKRRLCPIIVCVGNVQKQTRTSGGQNPHGCDFAFVGVGFRSRPELQGVKTQPHSCSRDRGVQKQTRTSGGQNASASVFFVLKVFRSKPELQGVKTHSPRFSLSAS